MIRTAIVEDISRLAEALKEKVELSSEYEICWIAGNGQQALDRLAEASEIDVIFMDIRRPLIDALAAT